MTEKTDAPKTAELIAQAQGFIGWERSGISMMVEKLCDALTAQAQEIEEWKQATSVGDHLYQIFRARAEAAEARVQEQSNQIAKLIAERNGHEARAKVDTETIEILRAELGRVGVLKESYLALRLDLMKRIERLEARVELLERTYVPRIPNEGG
jgi:DNA-binding transcriptional regulator GbsR (MarR family)